MNDTPDLTVLEVRITLDDDGDIHQVQMDSVSNWAEAAWILTNAARAVLAEGMDTMDETQH